MIDPLACSKTLISRPEWKGQMTLMDSVPSDQLGRRAKFRSNANRAQRTGKVLASAFDPPKGRNDISVDCFRIDLDDETGVVANIASAEFNDKFYGWYMLTVRDVERAACSVRLSPTASNPYHADILYPENEAVEWIHRFRHLAQRVASTARFKPWPEGNQEANGRYVCRRNARIVGASGRSSIDSITCDLKSRISPRHLLDVCPRREPVLGRRIPRAAQSDESTAHGANRIAFQRHRSRREEGQRLPHRAVSEAGRSVPATGVP